MPKKKINPETPAEESDQVVLPETQADKAEEVNVPERLLLEETALAASYETKAEASTQPPTPENAVVENSMAVSVSAQQDAEVMNSMVFSIAAGRDLTATNSMITSAAVGHDLELQEGGACMLVVGGQAQVDNSTIGLLVARSEAISLNNSKIIMTTPQAIALGATLGAVFAILRVLLGRRYCK